MIIHQVTGHLINWLNHESSPSPLPLCDFERFRHELKPCDVILVEGRSRVSGVIRLITASPWTHAALYIGRIHDIEDEGGEAEVCDGHLVAGDEGLVWFQLPALLA